jgi:hypothetical protein
MSVEEEQHVQAHQHATFCDLGKWATTCIVVAYHRPSSEFHEFELSVWNVPGLVGMCKEPHVTHRSVYDYLTCYGRRVETQPHSGCLVFAA